MGYVEVVGLELAHQHFAVHDVLGAAQGNDVYFIRSLISNLHESLVYRVARGGGKLFRMN
ncbi:hypothetical protein ACFQT0_06235 [Hymenobacter humi]|uniref:Uncharacterized protein n=1 Tax=Hymenobacter humi TaxID=1411620 RepID=A0ABW2U4U8_9BACT